MKNSIRGGKHRQARQRKGYNMANSMPFTLKEIAQWGNTAKGDKLVEIPAFQRGLVWNAAQIEVLWDSIMRGIPIGAFSLLPKRGNGKYSKSGEVSCDDGYFLLDGQQRANAIALGYKQFTSGTDENDSILWFDVLPDESEKKRSNRKFFFYVTTPARPWGYRIDDSNGENRAGRVSVAQYRAALDEIRYESMASKPATSQLWPVCARLPVPVSVLRNLPQGNQSVDGIISAGGDTRWVAHFKRVLSGIAMGDNSVKTNALAYEIRGICKRLAETDDVYIMAMIAPDSIAADRENGESDDNTSEIALYFSRLNRGGTMPDREDLDYSILKSILPKLHVIDECAKDRMHPSRLAHLAMLAFLSTETAQGWKRNLTRKDIMDLRNKPAFAEYIATGLQQDIESIDRWILYRAGDAEFGMPKYLRTQISRQQPNLYRFLLILAMKIRERRGIESVDFAKAMTALCTTLAWFGNDSSLDFAKLARASDEIAASASNGASIMKILGEWMGVQIENEALVPPPTLEYFQKIEKATASDDMNAVREAWSDLSQSDAANRIWYWHDNGGRGVVLYACRRYMESEFGGYDPATAVWNEDSRPWDYDHIVPQAWLKGTYHGEHHELVHEFLNSIGNIAPIPFGANRSKHDVPPGQVALYIDCAKPLFVDFAVEGRIPNYVNKYRFLENDAKEAFYFARATSRRMTALYAEWWNTLDIGDLLSACSVNRRKETFEEFAETLQSLVPDKADVIRKVYVVSDGRQLNVVKAWDWARPWIACGITGWYCRRDPDKRIKAMLCMVFQGETFKYGIRRHPDETLLDSTSDWWISNHGHEERISEMQDFGEIKSDFKKYAGQLLRKANDCTAVSEWFEVAC